MKRWFIFFGLFFCIFLIGVVDAQESVRFYRLLDSDSGDHFYTIDKNEMASAVANGYISEGVEGYIYAGSGVSGTSPLYRFWNSVAGSHFYTTSVTEKDGLLGMPSVWTYEGIEGYIYTVQISGTSPLYRFWNSVDSSHFYTTSVTERDKLLGMPSVWTYEGIEGYVKLASLEDDSQIIMKLFSFSNSHGGVWDSSYGYNIYYDEVFGSAYSGDLETVHNCNGNNKVVGLSASTNAHAEVPLFNNYLTGVCYGNLQCVKDVSAGSSCLNGGSVVVRLFSETNSHVSGALGTYPIKICCRSEGVFPSGSSVLEWRDMSGNVITSANVGDTVKMAMTNSLAGSFEVWEEDSFLNFDDAIRVGGDAILGVVEGNDVVGLWAITDEDLSKTNDYEEFYFSVNGNTSGYLNVGLSRNDEPMIVNISEPRCGADFDEGSSVAISVSAVDGDDLIIGNVSVDGVVVPFSNGGISFNHVFSAPGNYQVIAQAINSRGKKSRGIASVMVLEKSGGNYVDGDYVAACIDKPEDFSNIPGSVVEFDASNTKGIKVVDRVRNYVLPGSSGLNFYWSFFPDGRTYGEEYVGTGNLMAYKFITEFAVAGDNSATLRVEVI